MNNIKRKEILLKEHSNNLEHLKRLPDGRLSCTRNGKYYKWLFHEKGVIKVIPKSKRKLAENLAYKEYLLARNKDIENEIIAIDKYNKYYDTENLYAASVTGNAEMCRLLKATFTPNSETIIKWQAEDYERNPNYPEQLNHRCISGHFVRSKSEVMIADALFRHGIVYRYESKLVLGGVNVYPDFCVKHPKSGELIYWEHFGLMADYDYVRKYNSKMKLYTEAGFIPTINLIATYETSAHPLDAVEIEEIIEKYFL